MLLCHTQLFDHSRVPTLNEHQHRDQETERLSYLKEKRKLYPGRSSCPLVK